MENDPKAFVFWLQGFFELSNPSTLNEQQVQVIKEHLALVLNKKTPTIIQGKEWDFRAESMIYPTGPKCGGCNKTTSEEGGTCKKCRSNKTAAQLPIVDVPTCLTC
jgi:hypothetical protein